MIGTMTFDDDLKPTKLFLGFGDILVVLSDPHTALEMIRRQNEILPLPCTITIGEVRSWLIHSKIEKVTDMRNGGFWVYLTGGRRDPRRLKISAKEHPEEELLSWLESNLGLTRGED
jgi:hypothetical protein